MSFFVAKNSQIGETTFTRRGNLGYPFRFSWQKFFFTPTIFFRRKSVS